MTNDKWEGLPIDPVLRGRANVTKDELQNLGRLCREYKVSEKTRFTLAVMASYPPPVRLAVNLKTVIGRMGEPKNPRMNALNDGLTEDEYSALVELDIKALPSQAREIAHGLFNVHERWFVMKELRRLFRGADAARHEFISPAPEEEDVTGA